MSPLKRSDEYTKEELLEILSSICNQIYIARNITLSNQTVLDNLQKIDILFREENLN